MLNCKLTLYFKRLIYKTIGLVFEPLPVKSAFALLSLFTCMAILWIAPIDFNSEPNSQAFGFLFAFVRTVTLLIPTFFLLIFLYFAIWIIICDFIGRISKNMEE